jgi:hypothetical protein
MINDKTVTMSRELAERLDNPHSYVRNLARKELRGMLARTVCSKGILCGDVTCECKGNGYFDKVAAPVVERQPAAWMWSEEFVGGKFDGEEANDGVSFGPEKPNIKPSISGTTMKYKALYTAPPELAELQATIAQQAAEIERLKRDHQHVVDRNALLRQRPDLPFDRLPAHKRLEELQASQPAPVPIPAVPSFADGVDAAAKLVEKRLDDYVNEHGSHDPETGAVEFPGTGEEYVGELMEISEAIRTLACLDKVKELNQ